MAKPYNYQAAGDVTVTTTGNIDDLDFSGCTLIRMNNATDATIRGLKAGYAGERLVIVSVGAGNVFLAHQDTNSAAANRLINVVTSGSTPLAAGKGAAIYDYDSATARWRLASHQQGAYIPVAYNSANFTATTGTWTVDLADQITYSYLIVNNECRLEFVLDATSTSSITADLFIAIPNGFTVKTQIFAFFQALDNLSIAVGTIRALVGETIVRLQSTVTGAGWAVSTNQTYARGIFGFEVT